MPFGYLFRATVFLLGLAAVVPTRGGDLKPRPHPSADYASAVARVAGQQLADDSVVSPGGRTLLLAHGHRTSRAIVLLHGFTNSPRQFLEIGQTLYAEGDNVLMPRLPHHAEDHGDVSVLKRITAEALRNCADTAVDEAIGLGDTVIVVGLSAGGTMAAWAGQYRPEVRRVVLIAPALELTHVPELLQRPLLNLGLRIPNVTRAEPRDTTTPDRNKGFTTRAIAQVLRLGADVRHRAEVAPPAVRDAEILINASDRTVASGPSFELARSWGTHGAHVHVYEFPDSLRLPHDVIDARHAGANPAASYPVVLALVRGEKPPAWVSEPALR